MRLPKIDFRGVENLQKVAQRLRTQARDSLKKLRETSDTTENRKRILATALVVVIAVAMVSWIAGVKIQSPAEAAARTAPPAPSPILVPVETRVLTSDIVTRGTARYGSPQSISLAPSALKTSAGIITMIPEKGTPLKEGDVMLIASGRPVFVLQGEIPTYRDLVPGISGDDVLQLEAALQRLGFNPGQVDRIYDQQTSGAVADWYAAAGFESFGPTESQRVALHTLEDEFALATNQKLAAEDAFAAAPLAVEAARAQMSYDVAIAGESKKKVAQLAGEVAVQAALDAQKSAAREVERLKSLVDRISSELDTAKLKDGVQVPIDEVVFIPILPLRVEEVGLDIGGEARGMVMTVTNNELLIASALPLSEAPLVKTGLSVSIDEPDLGIRATGVISRIADSPGTDGVDGYHIYFETLVDETEVSLEGFSLRLTIPIESTGEAVIVVPISALSLTADGTSRVQVDDKGTLKFVTVQPGLSAGGFVEVTPVNGTLSPGQFVVIGYENKQ